MANKKTGVDETPLWIIDNNRKNQMLAEFKGAKQKALHQIDELRRRVVNCGVGKQIDYGYIGDLNHVTVRINEIMLMNK